MKKIIAVAALPLLLAACQSTSGDDAAASLISAQDLQHHKWDLVKVDGKAVMTPEAMQPPSLEIGENMTANGNAGCNNFFGQAELDGNNFRIPQMGMTMKMCLPEVMDTEMALSKALGEWSEMTLTKETMVLSNDQHTLTFKLNDWK